MKLNWIDALIEMRKDESKVFECPHQINPDKRWNIRVRNDRVEFQLLEKGSPSGSWYGADITKSDQSHKWTLVEPWKEVDYAEFMEWYCNPANKFKQYQWKSAISGCWNPDTNLLCNAPEIVVTWKGYKIPKE